MTMKLTRAAYQKLLNEDIKWLEKTAPRTLERNHLIEIARWSMDAFYPPMPNIVRTAARFHDTYYGSQSVMSFNLRPLEEQATWIAAARAALASEDEPT